jgi:four helix bundle protein
MNPAKEDRSQKTEVRSAARNFQDLVLWQKAHRFVLEVYQYSAAFPRAETYGLTSQFRRAAVSIPANIAEGFRRRGKPDKARFLNTSQSSIEECRYYLILARDLNYGENEKLMCLLEEVSRIIDTYAKAILNSVF